MLSPLAIKFGFKVIQIHKGHDSPRLKHHVLKGLITSYSCSLTARQLVALKKNEVYLDSYDDSHYRSPSYFLKLSQTLPYRQVFKVDS